MPKSSLSQFNFFLFGLLILLGFGIFIGYQLQFPKLPAINEHQVKEEAISLIVKNTENSFLVTGVVDLVLAYTVSDMKKLFGIDLGTTKTEVRIPGKVFYGVNTKGLSAQDFVFKGDSVWVYLPPVEMLTVTPNLAKMEMKTEVGWARMYQNSGRGVEQKALKSIPDRMKAQALAYLSNPENVQKNTKKALAKLLLPLLKAKGIKNPQVFILPKNPTLKIQEKG